MKKIISVLLITALLFATMASASFAKDTVSGKCGDNANWILDLSTGELVISGTGDINGISIDADPSDKWGGQFAKVKSVTICDGITGIGMTAFTCCSNLTSVTIGDDVTVIESEAFWNCRKLSTVKIGKSVAEIGDMAFHQCMALTDIVIPGNVKTIESMAFGSCSNLKNVTLENGVTEIADYAFNGTPLTTSIIIPESVTKIGYLSFAGSNLEKVIFKSSGPIDLSESAFGYDSKAMICCEENSWLHSYADANDLRVCIFDKNGEPSFELKNDVLICYRGNATDVFVNAGTKIGYGAFENNKKVKNIELSSAVNRIYDRAFKDCSALNTVIIPQSVASIGDNSFDGCGNLTIYGYAGSYAESYAKQKGIKFEYITLNVSADTYAVNVLDTLQLEASYNILLNDDENIIWSCDDNGVASVSQTGEVTALKAGETVVTATAENGLYATCVIKVEDSGNTGGDLNGDGIANSTDALIILQHTVGKITIDEKLIPFADVNDDNFVNSTDALKILQFTIGKINKL